MTAVVFETPGLIDLRAFTIMGAHAKPRTDNPIGFFGTGLKYAIAVLVRLGATPTAYVGRDRLRFSKRPGKFRGTDLETIRMEVLRSGNVRATSYELPFTTRYGERWEPWMAFRELESNTRDEGGMTYRLEEPGEIDLGALLESDDKTRIVVNLPAFATVDVDDVFLRRGRRAAPGTILEAFPGESERLWYRTMRVLDLPKPTLMTYNFLEEMTLTEDRTLKNLWEVRNALARWVLTAASADEVEMIVKADDEHWEHDLAFPSWVAPSEAFVEVMRDRKKPAPKPSTWTPSFQARPVVPGRISRAAFSYFGPRSSAYAPAPAAAPRAWSLADEHPRPWRVEELHVVDAKGKAVFAMPDDAYDEDDWARVADAVVRRINMTTALPPKLSEAVKPVENFANAAKLDAEEEMPF